MITDMTLWPLFVALRSCQVARVSVQDRGQALHALHGQHVPPRQEAVRRRCEKMVDIGSRRQQLSQLPWRRADVNGEQCMSVAGSTAAGMR